MRTTLFRSAAAKLALIGEQHGRQRERPVNYRALIDPAGGHGTPAPEQQEQDEREPAEEDGCG
jgi:hypothetical protein